MFLSAFLVCAAAQAVVQPPLLKWQYAGCTPSDCETGWYASPAVANVDADAPSEVLWGGYDLSAFNGTSGAEEWRLPNASRIWPAIAAADLDGNGSTEIIVGRGGNQLTVYSGASVLWTRSPFAGGEVRSLAVADLERDGDLEIIVGRASSGGTLQVSVYDWGVLPSPGASSGPLSQDFAVIENSVSNAVLADLDNDGRKEILFASYDGKLHAWWLDKTEHHSWPYDVPGSGIRFAAEPVVADLDNDGYAEVLFTSYPEKHDNWVGQLHVLNHQGQEIFAPINLPAPRGNDWNGGLGAPTLANLDADGDLELVIGTAASGAVAYDLPGSAAARVLWGSARGGMLRNGVAFEDRIFVNGFEG